MKKPCITCHIVSKKNIYLQIDNLFQEHDMKAGHSIRKRSI